MIDSGMMQRMMREMMGVELTEDERLPVQSADGRQRQLASTVKDGVREFQLSAQPIRWEYAAGKTLLAWGYNGQVPGPEIRVSEGERIRVVFTNRLPKATTIHWHGIDVPNDQDGVPGVTQDPIAAGETYTYEFTVQPAGTHFYHTHGSFHGDEAQQMDAGLSGAFIIEPRGYIRPDKEYTLILDEWQVSPMSAASGGATGWIRPALAHGGDGEEHEHMMNLMMAGTGHGMEANLFTINGLAFPDAEPIRVSPGQRVRLRMINAGTSTFHPMHLHGHQFKIVATDGNPVPPAAQLTRNTTTVHPGETVDIEFTAGNPGAWLLHCHELHHADAGMIVPVLYDGFSLPETTEVTPAAGQTPPPAGMHQLRHGG